MGYFSIIVIASLVLATIVVLMFVFGPRRGKKNPSKKKAQVKDRETIIREANRKLASNPRDAKALESLADLYYAEADYPKAMHTYKLLLDQNGPEDLDERKINLRYGVSAMKCESWNAAYRGLSLAHAQDTGNFEVNSNLGRLEYMRKNYPKAINLLKSALTEKPDHAESLKTLGQCFYKMKKYKEALPYLRQAVAARPEDKESMFALARSLFEVPHYEMAGKLFRHLRTDPVWGPHAALFSGQILCNKREWEEAVTDFRIGLKHENIQPDLMLEIKYRLVEALNQLQKIDEMLLLLNEIYAVAPDYKDVAAQLKRYRELNSNQNLRVYMLAPANEFVALCRKIIEAVFPRARIKVTDIDVQKNEYVDILAELKTSRWEDVIIFRFMRTEGQVGELFVRDLYARSKELHAGRGFCFSPGSYSKEAVRFVEARLIDLVDKSGLVKYLKAFNLGALSSM